MRPKLSIVVPCYNEEKNIPFILERFALILADYPAELILVDNGSRDGSAGVFKKELQKSVYHFVHVVTVPKNIGYGHGIVTGLRSANGKFLAWTHADLQTDPRDVIRAYDVILKYPDPDNVLIKGIRKNRRVSGWAFTLGMSLTVSIVLGTVLTDINAQPKLFTRRFFEKYCTKPPDDFSLDLYLLYIAKKNHVRIQTIPVCFGQRLHGESKWAFSFRSKIKTILRTVRYIFNLRKSFDV